MEDKLHLLRLLTAGDHCAMRRAQADEREEAAARFLELSAALEAAEAQLADKETRLHSLLEARQQVANS